MVDTITKNIYIETTEGNFYKKPISTIQLNNDSSTELIIAEKTNISVSVETKIKENQTFYIKKQ
ncbi:MAG: hypothetical protein V7K97_12820 [Nostoc sp.]|uniref:hypothetical protein n=1 Tax=Nostoc sp. TaxID=1180 RepID=UPI002FF4C9D8